MNVKYIEFEKLYRKIAKKNNTSAENVKRDMQLAIDAMWESNNPNAKALFPNGKPSIEKFLTTVKNQLI